MGNRYRQLGVEMITNLKFHKYVAAGNDFVILDNWEQDLTLQHQQIVSLCDRRFGIGADGVLQLSPAEEADFTMTYFNADGSRGEMCGNGARALIKFALDQERISGSGTFSADDGLHEFTIDGDRISVEIRVPDEFHDWATPKAGCGFINTGVPHLIVPTADVHEEDLISLGNKMNSHPDHPEGINTNIVSRLGGLLEVRTWERGVNNETLACGTGATAVAIYAVQKWSLNWPVRLQFKGGILEVDFHDNRYWLTGSTALVFAGHIA